RQLARQTLALVRPLVRREAPIEFAVAEDGGDARAPVDAGPMQHVFTNVLVNAIQAMPRGGTIRIGARAERARPPDPPGAPEAEHVVVTIEDEGPGIAPEHLDRIFEPFFTTKDVGQGTGLGLSVSHGIAREHGGWIAAASRPGAGSRFSIYVPKEGSGGCRAGS
ncbi:MAG TPA: ATP-binding protein, partial [Planctomycetota bacterium]|nr:ATP-binding protein [Planctomycetota bacterium]